MPSTMRLTRQTWLCDGVLELQLCDPSGAALPEWEPGSHITIELPDGTARDYSLCGDQEDRTRWTVAVLRERESRGGSSFVHERLRVGELLDVTGPRNNFPLGRAQHYLLLAGGIGITPIKAMAESLAARGADWKLLYCGRSRSAMAFLPELQRLCGDRITVHCDDEQSGPPDLAAVLGGDHAEADVYCCGPEPFIAAVEDNLPEAASLHVERFRAAAAQHPATDDGFDVVCDGSGTRVRVEPGTSILSALRGSGMDLPSSCEEGICGTCETKVLGGEPEHRDHVLTDAEKGSNETMMLCVSRCRSAELVLDL